MVRLFSQFRPAIQVAFMTLIWVHVSTSTPIHPAIKFKLQDTTTMTPNRFSASVTTPPTVQDDVLLNSAEQQSVTSVPTSFISSGPSALSYHQTNHDASAEQGHLQRHQQERKEEKDVNLGDALTHATLKKQVKCDYSGCGYTSAKISNVNVHKRTHDGDKPFQCVFPGCEYAAAQKVHIKQHKIYHDVECDGPRCESTSTQKDYTNSKVRKRIYNAEIPFHCDYPGCDFTSSRNFSLKRHKTIHSENKPFQCDYPGCEYAARQKVYLEKHKMTHSGEKPYRCYHCDYAAIQRSSIFIHKRTHAEEKPFRCDHTGCKYASDQRGNLNRHKHTHNKELNYVAIRYCVRNYDEEELAI